MTLTEADRIPASPVAEVHRSNAEPGASTQVLTERPYDRERKASESLIKGMLSLMSGRAAAMAVGLLLAPVVTRLYSPDAFGPVTLLTSLVATLSVFGTLSYPRALALAKSAEMQRAVFVLCLFLIVITTTISAFATLLTADVIASLYGDRTLATFLLFFPVLFLAASLGILLDFALNRGRNYRILAIRSFVERTTTSGSQILLALALFGDSKLGLVLGYLAGTLSSSLLGVTAVISRMFPPGRRTLPLNRVVVAMHRFRRLPKVYVWSQFISTAGVGAPVLILSAYYPMHVIGLYALAYRILQLPSMLFTQASSQVYYVEASSLLSAGRSAAMPTMMLLGFLSRATALPVVLLCLMGAPVFEVVFGDAWREAGLYAQILSPWIMMTVVGAPFMSLLSAQERFGEALAYTTSIFSVRVTALILGGAYLSPRVTLAIYSFSNLLLWAVVLARVFRLAGVSTRSAALVVLRQYSFAAILLLPASFVYWVWDMQITGAVLLVVGCAICLWDSARTGWGQFGGKAGCLLDARGPNDGSRCSNDDAS